MADWLGSVKDLVPLVLLGSVAGIIPRVGLVRALSVGFRSYFRTAHPLSVRASEVQRLGDSLRWMEKGDYIAVTGGKGIGKTCLIEAALNRQFGVVNISVSSSFVLESFNVSCDY